MSFDINKWRKKAIKMYGKARGLSETQRKKVTSALHTGRSPATSRGAKGGTRKTTKKTKRRYSMTIPIAPVLGMIAGLAQPVQMAMEGRYEDAISQATYHYTGWDMASNQWKPEGLLRGIAPLIIGLLVHKFVGGSPLNLNRILARAKIPFLRI